jgi:hypothetical protein
MQLSSQINSEKKRSVNARSKGRRGEQEVATMLRDVLKEVLGEEHGVEIKRNLMQWAGAHRTEGQGDISGLEWLSIEVKRVENDLPSGLKSWWEQCKSQAHARQQPVLFHRMNGRDWNIRTYIMTLCGDVQIKLPVDMEWRIFRVWLKQMIKSRFSNPKSNL